MKAGQKILVLAAFLLLLTPASVPAQQNPPPEAPKVRSESVALTVTVMNAKSQAMKGFEQSNFSVFENKVAQVISSFSSRDEPISVGILFDASGSMSSGSPSATKRKLQILINALSHFLELSHPANEYFVVGISSRPSLLLDWTSDRQAVIEKLGSLEVKGNTALYDACYPGIEKVIQGRYSKGVIILISDGQDNNSRHKFREVRELLKASSVLLYSVGVVDISDASSLGMEGQGVLDELSAVSGGKAFFPRWETSLKPTEINEVFELIGQQLRNQYTITFASAPSTGKKKWHKIKVKVSPPPNATREMRNLHVRAREGYYQY